MTRRPMLPIFTLAALAPACASTDRTARGTAAATQPARTATTRPPAITADALVMAVNTNLRLVTMSCRRGPAPAPGARFAVLRDDQCIAEALVTDVTDRIVHGRLVDATEAVREGDRGARVVGQVMAVNAELRLATFSTLPGAPPIATGARFALFHGRVHAGDFLATDVTGRIVHGRMQAAASPVAEGDRVTTALDADNE